MTKMWTKTFEQLCIATSLTAFSSAILILASPVKASEWMSPSVDLPVFFVTNRQPENQRGKIIYGKKRRYNNLCQYGIGHAVVGRRKDDSSIVGDLWNMGWRGSNVKLKDPGYPQPVPASATSIETFPDKLEFFRKLESTIALSEGQQMVLFVHGYNNSFESSLESAARLEAEFKCPVVLFSWPSQNETLKYTSDECNVEWSWPDLRIFLRDLDSRIGPEKVVVVAHSMGNRLAMWSLVSRFDQNNQEPRKYKSIVLSSPDIDAGTLRAWSPLIRKNAESNWILISHKDIPLRLSRGVHGHQRSGEIQKYPKASDVDMEWKYPDVPYGFTSIDFSPIDRGPLGHSIPYNDIEGLVRTSEAAKEDQLKSVISGSHEWSELRPASNR
ncbi:MAG: alpha/beta fold hydrolase [Candidatus Obscuribacter sp.]|nr:alpha/beta fold hydrolase [Candidatus Obscuribacter sp.]